jgi:hypothetical protein
VRAYQGTVKMTEKQTNFMNSVLKMNKPSVVISFGNPYLLSLFPESKTYITAYGDAVVSMQAMIKAITGKADITGKLPISIPGTGFKTGDGIEIKHNILFADAEGYDFIKTSGLISKYIEEKLFPAASIVVSSGNKILFKESYGKADFFENSPEVNNNFIYDIDEVTSLFTTAGALALATEGRLAPENSVAFYLPEYKNKNVLVKDLMYQNPENPKIHQNLIAAVRNGENNSILLQKVIEKVTGYGLDKILNEKIFLPLGMNRTMFNLKKEYWYYALPTSDEVNLHKRNKGVVYDEEAFKLNGVAGHSGLFTTTEDMAKFLQMIIQKGKYNNKEIISEEMFSLWYTQSEDIFVSGKTGSAVWVNPSMKRSVVFFTNSSFSGRTAEMMKLYPDIYNSVINNISY